jgi:hypothetical protein
MLLTWRKAHCSIPNDISWQYCIIIMCGVDDNFHILLHEMKFWNCCLICCIDMNLQNYIQVFFCYSALIASGPLLLSPPSLPTFVHTLVSGIMCVIYASRNSLLQAVLKFTYGNLVTQLSSPTGFLLFYNIFTTSKLISHCQYQKHSVSCCCF